MSENKCGFMNVCISLSFCIMCFIFFIMICSICFIIVAEILNPRIDDMLYLLYLSYLPGTFLVVLQVRGCVHTGFTPFTHTHSACIFLEWDPKTPDLKSIELKGFSDTGMDVLSTLVFMRISARVCSLIVCS